MPCVVRGGAGSRLAENSVQNLAHVNPALAVPPGLAGGTMGSTTAHSARQSDQSSVKNSILGRFELGR
jgi:hypothetical protein